MKNVLRVFVVAALMGATAALAQSSVPFQQFNIGRPSQQEAVGTGSDALKALGVQSPADPLKRLEPPRTQAPAAAAAPSAAPAAPVRPPSDCRARVTISSWTWTNDGRRPVALNFTVESDEAARSRAVAVDFGFEYRGANAEGAPLNEPVKSYISTEVLRLAAGENPAKRSIETGPILVGRTVMERIVVGTVACRAE